MKYLKPILVFFLITGFSIYAFTQILQFEKKIESPANRVTCLVETDDQALMILCELIGNDSVYVGPYYSHINHTLLYKVTLEGDTLWSKVFTNYKMDTEYFTEIIKTADGNFLLMDCGEYNIHLLKINTYGDSIWSKSIEESVYNPKILKAIETCDNNILLLCDQDRVYFGYQEDVPILLKISQTGDKLWEHFISEESARDMMLTQDDKILLLVSKSSSIRLISDNDLLKIYEGSHSIVLQSYDLNGNFIKELNYPFVEANGLSMAINKQKELFIAGQYCYPPDYRMKGCGGLLMNINDQGIENWTRFYNVRSVSSVWPLASSNVLTVSWPYLSTINNNGDSLNGYQFNYELNIKQKPLILISGNDLYQAGMLKNEDSFMLTKLNLALISDGDYKPTDSFSQSINIYPNPASDYIYIDLSWVRKSDLVSTLYSDDFKVFVYDASGRQIKDADLFFVNNELVVPVQDLADGLYFFNIHLMGGKVITKKIMVAR